MLKISKITFIKEKFFWEAKYEESFEKYFEKYFIFLEMESSKLINYG
jgi:hypothetical protein